MDYDWLKERVYQGKRVNPPYRPHKQGNPSYVIFRYGTQFFLEYYSLYEWTGEATFSKLPKMKWRERHCVCFDF